MLEQHFQEKSGFQAGKKPQRKPRHHLILIIIRPKHGDGGKIPSGLPSGRARSITSGLRAYRISADQGERSNCTSKVGGVREVQGPGREGVRYAMEELTDLRLLALKV